MILRTQNNDAAIEIKRLSISSDKPILSELNLRLAMGESVSVQGESGTGKSTLCFAVLGYIAKGLNLKSGNIHIGEWCLMSNGNLTSERDIRIARRLVGHLDQDPAASITPTRRLGYTLRELAAGTKGETELQLKRALEIFQLPTDDAFLMRYPSEISGGQRRRIALARILLRQPKLLLLDEPTAGLDPKSKQGVIALLRILREETGAAMLTITHDPDLAEELATRQLILRDGGLRPLDQKRVVRSKFRLELPPSSSCKPALEVSGLTASAPSLIDAPIKDLSFVLCKGEALAITGSSGAGKSTIARTICGLWPLIKGEIRLYGHLLSPSLEDRPTEIRALLGWVPQDPLTSFNPALKLKTSLNRALKRSGTTSSMSLKEACALVNLNIDWENRYPSQISGGQLQRLAIVRALVGGAKILILDEVTSSLDPNTTDHLIELLKRIKQDLPLLLISHNPKVISEVGDRVLDLDAGILNATVDHVFDIESFNLERKEA